MVSTSQSTESPTEPTGEPMHDHFALCRLATPAANDCRTFLAGHKDIITRLSAEEPPLEAKGPFGTPADLAQPHEFLLRVVIEQPSDVCAALRSSHPEGVADVKACIQQPCVDKAQIWKRLYGARPTRLAVARVARWADASVHSSMGFYNFPSAGSFRREVRALVRWYSKGKRVSRWRRGIARAANASPRVRASDASSPRRCALTCAGSASL